MDKVSRSYKREAITVMKDFPDIGDTGSKREEALIELLRCIEENDYKKLRDLQYKEDDYTKYKFFLVSKDTLGIVYPFYHLLERRDILNKCDDEMFEEFETKASLLALYLSPILEGLDSDDNIIAVVAHELAHIFRKHKSFENRNPKEENEAWEQVCEWGFRNEAKNYLEWRKEKRNITITLEPSTEQFSFQEKKGGDLNGCLS